MDKREFLKASGAFVTGSMLSRFSSAQQQEPGSRTNWAGNLTYSTDHLHSPGTVEEVRQVVKSCDKLRALGSRHSFNAIADSTANQISLKRLDTMKLDEKAHTVTVGGGVPYGVVAPWLDSRGYALHNLASLPHISVAGAIAWHERDADTPPRPRLRSAQPARLAARQMRIAPGVRKRRAQALAY